jgi:hypothetical protein
VGSKADMDGYGTFAPNGMRSPDRPDFRASRCTDCAVPARVSVSVSTLYVQYIYSVIRIFIDVFQACRVGLLYMVGDARLLALLSLSDQYLLIVPGIF